MTDEQIPDTGQLEDYRLWGEAEPRGRCGDCIFCTPLVSDELAEMLEEAKDLQGAGLMVCKLADHRLVNAKKGLCEWGVTCE